MKDFIMVVGFVEFECGSDCFFIAVGEIRRILVRFILVGFYGFGLEF